MPKVKGKDSLRKRFRVTPHGKVMHRRTGKRHLMRKKDTKRRLRLRKPNILNPPVAKKVKSVPHMSV